MTTTSTERLIEQAKLIRKSKEQDEIQRRGFAYGNAKTENDRVTREMIDRAAAKHPRDG